MDDVQRRAVVIVAALPVFDAIHVQAAAQA